MHRKLLFYDKERLKAAVAHVHPNNNNNITTTYYCYRCLHLILFPHHHFLMLLESILVHYFFRFSPSATHFYASVRTTRLSHFNSNTEKEKNFWSNVIVFHTVLRLHSNEIIPFTKYKVGVGFSDNIFIGLLSSRFTEKELCFCFTNNLADAVMITGNVYVTVTRCLLKRFSVYRCIGFRI